MTWRPLLDEMRLLSADFDSLARSWAENYVAGGGRLYCRRGCRSCCTLAVQVPFLEALEVANALDEKQAAAAARQAARLQERMRGVTDLKEYLRRHRRLGFCPFLDADGACGVYQSRPVACRTLLSTRPEEWCGVDFATLHPLEREAFLSSLDPSVVAFPTHYAGPVRTLGRSFEARAIRKMRDRFGFALTGNLPFLVWLELEHRLSAAVAEGVDATVGVLAAAGGNSPFLVALEA